MKAKPMPSLDRLKEVLSYDPGTGVFLWIKTLSPRGKKGLIAGSKNAEGYLRIQIDGVVYMAHRLAWYFVKEVPPKCIIDHIDRDITNNRIDNLRDLTDQQSSMNRGVNSRNKSGVKGVCWDKAAGKWKTTIKIHGKTIFLGNFSCISAAANAYADGSHKYHGQYGATS